MTFSAAETYTVLARRFRPQAFADVVGQEHIAQALCNAIQSNRVAHAYLFTGARGVGKTSTARILAKALNCPKSEHGNPCNECEICHGISAGNDVDVLEIDGASNRGIDSIRELRANVNLRSMRTKYKLYIIDEVHMLTKEAFNALLKTLEEPPPNVKFVFCTTEPNKVPDTILSRCQRFDFGTIETANIKLRLAQIADAEGVEVAPDALELVARRAAGSMRDSQSIFDQLLAFGEEHITAEDVHRLLGTASDDRLITVADALISRDQGQSLDAFHAALESGVQLGELTDQLLFYMRDLMVLASGALNVELMSVSPGARDVLTTQAQKWGLQTIIAAMQILSDTKARMQRVTYGRALAELALVRISLLENLTGIQGLIDKLKSGEPLAALGAGSSGEKKNDRVNAQPEVTAQVATASRVESSIVESPVSESQRPVAIPEATADAAKVAPAAARPEVTAEPGMPVPEMRPQEAPLVAEAELSSPDEIETGSGEVAADSEERTSQPEILATGSGRVKFSRENAVVVWSEVLGQINDMLKNHVQNVSASAIFAPNRLELTFPRKYAFSKRYCETPESIARLEQIASELTGVTVRVTLVFGAEDLADQQQRSEKKKEAASTRARVYKPEEDEFVSAVMTMFEAQCVRVSAIAAVRSEDDGDGE